jgi:hypothetical protein
MNGLRVVLFFVALAGLLWMVANVIEAWRYERGRRPRRPFLLRLRFITDKPPATNHASKVPPCQILKFSTRK